MADGEIPIWARVHLTHAVVQAIADEVGADVLHVKGPALDPSLRTAPRLSSDVDVLVRPGHLASLLAGLVRHDWSLHTDFEEGSSFGHAANYRHPSWAYVDVHRLLPGPTAGPETVFEQLWTQRRQQQIGHQPCWVPSLTGQVLVVALHSARAHHRGEVEAWELASPGQREAARALARRIGAEVPLAAALGELESYLDHPDHDLWRYWSSESEDPLTEWRERMRASPTLRGRARLLLRMARVNRTHLRLRLGREPRRHEVAVEAVARVLRAARLTAGRLRRPGRPDRTDGGRR